MSVFGALIVFTSILLGLVLWGFLNEPLWAFLIGMSGVLFGLAAIALDRKMDQNDPLAVLHGIELNQ